MARVLVFLAACSLTAAGQSCQPFKVLLFWKTAGFAHTTQIQTGIAALQTLGPANGFVADHTNDATLFNAPNLAQYSVVVFLYTTGDVLDPTQQSAFEAWSL